MGDCPTAAAAECPHLAITSSSICSNERLMKVRFTNALSRSLARSIRRSVGRVMLCSCSLARSPQDDYEHASLD